MTTKDIIETGKTLRGALCAKGWAAIRTPAESSGSRQGSSLPVWCLVGAVAMAPLAFCMSSTWADGSGDPTAVKNDNGKYYDKAGNPTFNIASDGTVNWYTYSGYRRFNSECEVCHGFDGQGSTFAPSLLDSLKTLSYSDFTSVVVGGRRDVNTANDKVMPSFGTDRNVMCYLDDIYIYLRARSDGKLGGGRPEKHVDKPAAAAKAETACMGF
jgi:methanol metabolism-related c-type cytochrome